MFNKKFGFLTKFYELLGSVNQKKEASSLKSIKSSAYKLVKTWVSIYIFVDSV